MNGDPNNPPADTSTEAPAIPEEVEFLKDAVEILTSINQTITDLGGDPATGADAQATIDELAGTIKDQTNN